MGDGVFSSDIRGVIMMLGSISCLMYAMRVRSSQKQRDMSSSASHPLQQDSKTSQSNKNLKQPWKKVQAPADEGATSPMESYVSS